jgi:hypothetical protein
MEKNVFLEKISGEELKTITGGAYKCSTTMPSYVKQKPNSSVYYAWLYANCTYVSSCSPTTWNQCY